MMGTGRMILAALTVLAVGGCMFAARIFLDVEKLEGSRQRGDSVAPVGSDLGPLQPIAPPLLIEAATEPDSVLALLATHSSGGVDWVASLREGMIRPRPGESSPDSIEFFGYDLYLVTGEGPEAYFPHSAHQEWLSCESCHPQVFRNGSGSVSAETAHDESSCAFCHGSVSFPIQACERCHEAASDLPAGRMEKTLGPEMTMARGDTVAWDEGRRRLGFEDLNLATSYQPSRFPHSMHRLRHQCRACHPRPFAMRSGATLLGQDEAHGGGACGSCHNGTVSFEIGLDECYRCHTETAAKGG